MRRGTLCPRSARPDVDDVRVLDRPVRPRPHGADGPALAHPARSHGDRRPGRACRQPAAGRRRRGRAARQHRPGAGASPAVGAWSVRYVRRTRGGNARFCGAGRIGAAAHLRRTAAPGRRHRRASARRRGVAGRSRGPARGTRRQCHSPVAGHRRGRGGICAARPGLAGGTGGLDTEGLRLPGNRRRCRWTRPSARRSPGAGIRGHHRSDR